MRMRSALATALLAFQLLTIAYARFVPARYFCWAPYDMQTEYEIESTVAGRALTPLEIRGRYRRGAHGFDNRSPQHVIDIIEQVERKLPPPLQATVMMKYRVNGKEFQEWQWRPPQPQR